MIYCLVEPEEAPMKGYVELGERTRETRTGNNDDPFRLFVFLIRATTPATIYTPLSRPPTASPF